MAAIVSAIEIDRSPAAVFAYATDPARFPEWQPDVVRVQVDGSGVGARFTTVRRIAGVERSMVQEITEDRPSHRWAVQAVDGLIRPSATVTVEPLDGGRRSRATFTLDFEGHGMGDLIVPLVRRTAAKAAPASYRRLKERLENDLA
ncbi:hypothetical protein GCM10023176_24210 [Micromonospora coerulea]|uniref:SRPBCC family protein n=1 Tax=Micromonospora coerulea TaxID=47856 RepID=A0ABP8SGV1_9ACTN